jgi:hypothetical protein
MNKKGLKNIKNTLLIVSEKLLKKMFNHPDVKVVVRVK